MSQLFCPITVGTWLGDRWRNCKRLGCRPKGQLWWGAGRSRLQPEWEPDRKLGNGGRSQSPASCRDPSLQGKPLSQLEGLPRPCALKSQP